MASLDTEPSGSTLSAVLRGPGHVELERIELGPTRAGEVRVDVAYSAICGSDLHAIGDPDDAGAATARDGLRLGHENSGIVRAVGPGVTPVSVVDAVACRPRSPCGE